MAISDGFQVGMIFITISRN